MQSARVKEILRPVHECLYDFLSSSRWLVRGDVTVDHIRRVVDGCEPGEDFVSGDYEAATNNIYVQVPWAIAQVLSESPDLSSEEREALLESFRPENLRWAASSGSVRPILRGSMMGNLMSFPMLCLLNKACYDIACSLRRNRTSKLRLETVIINGDDIAFAGDSQFYDEWVSVTSAFGLVVNREKTGVSRELVELNSRCFVVYPTASRRLRVLRKPVLSALAPGDNPDCLLSRLWDGLRTLSPGTFRWMAVMLRHEVIRRGVSLSSIPSRLRRVLVKERWFRRALLEKPVLVRSGVERAWPVVTSSEAPAEHLLPLYDQKCQELLRLGVAYARGRKCSPFSLSLKKGGPRDTHRLPAHLRVSFRTRWVWRWPAPLLRWWTDPRVGLAVRSLPDTVWLDDHRDLTISVVAEFSAAVPPVTCPSGCEPFGGGHLNTCLSG
jgi:hypothetical protein